MNKYERIPGQVIDLHGLTRQGVRELLDVLVREPKHAHVRVIAGKGRHSENGPVLQDFVRDYLRAHRIRFSQSKIADGGEGAFEVFLK